MPIKDTVPTWGKCGRRERESRREGRREQSLRESLLHVSWRSKASWFPRRRRSSRGDVETVTLVGPCSCVGFLPRRSRADDSGCPEDAEEGNVVAHAPQSSCNRRRHERSSHAHGRRVLRSVLRPVLVDPHYTRGVKSVDRGGAFGSASRLGKTRASGKNQHWGQTNGRCAARRVTPIPQGRGRVTSEKEEGLGLRPCEDERVRVPALAHRVSVAEVGRRRLASNKLGKRAPKRAAGSSERGPSSE
jgi:hypothetical protein